MAAPVPVKVTPVVKELGVVIETVPLRTDHCGVPLLALPAIAHAQNSVDEFGAYRLQTATRRESGQSAAVELRFGPYNPRVDSSFSDAKPFRSTFGTDNR